MTGNVSRDDTFASMSPLRLYGDWLREMSLPESTIGIDATDTVQSNTELTLPRKAAGRAGQLGVN